MAEKDTTADLPSITNEDNEVPGQLVKKFCQPCSNNRKKTAATVFCSNCKEFQCSECSNGHTIYSFMENHNLVDANTAYLLPLAYDMKGLDKCKKHDEVIKFFCRDHEKLCCSTCAVIEHRKCNQVNEINCMNLNTDEREQTLKIKISKLKKKSDAAVKYWTDSKNIMHAQLQNVFERLTAIRISVNKRLDEVEEDIKQQASSLSEVKTKEYDHNRLDCEGTVNVLKQDLAILDDVKRHGAPEHQFIAQHRVNESFESLRLKALDQWSNLEKNDICLQLNPKLEAILDSTGKFASLTTKTSKVSIDSIVEEMPVKLREIVSTDLKQTEDQTMEPLCTGMDFLQDGRLVVVDNKNNKCIILSDQLERLGSCTLSSIPQGVISVSEDEVAVTSGHKILFLRVSKSNEVTQIRTVATTSCCKSICLKDNDHFVVGVYNDTKPVRVISFLGEASYINVDFPNANFVSKDSTCTYIKNSDKVVLTDRCENTVYIYNIKDNTNVVVKDDRIKEPCGVAIGPFDIIFVCSKGTNTIVQISETGKILSSYKLDMTYPYRVCVSKDKRKLSISNKVKGALKIHLLCLDI